MAYGFHDGSRSLQDRFDTRALADRIDHLLVTDSISDGDQAFIEARDMFFLATAGLFGHADGDEWGVGHYRLAPAGEAVP